MKQREACMALLVTLLVLLLAGVVGIDAFRMLGQEERRRELEASRQMGEALQQARLAASRPARLGAPNILQAPEVTTVSGRDTRLQTTTIQANLLAVLQTSSPPLH